MVKEVSGQHSWLDEGLSDLRDAYKVDGLDPPALIEAGESEAQALSVILKALHLDSAESILMQSPVGPIAITKKNAGHIIEKRRDARERYVNFATVTIKTPYEIWMVDYDDGSKRYAFIGVFKGRTQMLVVVSIKDGLTLWNFMHSDAKRLNKHRHGKLVYRKNKGDQQ